MKSEWRASDRPARSSAGLTRGIPIAHRSFPIALTKQSLLQDDHDGLDLGYDACDLASPR